MESPPLRKIEGNADVQEKRCYHTAVQGAAREIWTALEQGAANFQKDIPRDHPKRIRRSARSALECGVVAPLWGACATAGGILYGRFAA